MNFKIINLQTFDNPKGPVSHGLKKSDIDFKGFGEAYFSEIYQGQIKGWKRHYKMIMNIIVPVGNVTFYLIEISSEKQFRITLGEKKLKRLFIPPEYWVAFEGIAKKNIILNLASIEHDPDEQKNVDLNHFNLVKKNFENIDVGM